MFSFNDLSIRAKNLFIAALLFGVVVYSYVTVDELIVKQNSAITTISVHNTESEGVAMPMATLAKDIQIDIIKVQQGLTDISATRGLDGLNDGFEMAEKYATLFNEHMDQALRISADHDLEKMTAILKNVDAAFPAFYDAGQKMAHAYVDYGPAGGNRLMAGLDEAAEKLQDSLQPLLNEAILLSEKTQSNITTDLKHVIESNDELDHANLVSLIIALTIIAFLILVAYTLISNPIIRLVKILDKMTDGYYDVTVPYPDRKDEVGTIAKAVEGFRAKAALTQELTQKFEHDIATLIQTFMTSATEMQKVSQTMSKSTNDTTDKTNIATTAIHDTTTNIQTVASASEELTASINEISKQIGNSANISTAVKIKIEDTSEKVRVLEEGVTNINAATTLISDIAEKTNLLALNATIEAARAGSAGKGFAVVASEVKGLATQTAKTTNEIEAQINHIDASTKDAVKAIRDIAKTIENMDQITSSVASSIEQQNSATSEISQRVQAVSAETQTVSENIVGVSIAANEAKKSTGIVDNSVTEVLKQTEHLGTLVSEFLNKINVKH